MIKETRLQKSSRVLNGVSKSEWCNVNINNEFIYEDTKYIIDNKVDEYKVYNKAGEVEDYTNEAYMEKVLVIVDNTDTLSFYDQNYNSINRKSITKL